ncbi:glycosyltransferase [Phytohabitans sp. ZYX-F-186]|uniref:Glycosyltransferase n=1 Tax=Phytohabitans maris TaxID=3071409 RepID=A0ABU0ZDC7_9ACTN|nr:glycosyltransferase [Phytohabitans sp. ZYX-F-186]MDQ7904434.1 glycosyltransferase [Phytohabitans sp. ZYX-F-186]
MRILFSGCPAYGHLHPMLPLARAAARGGHDVAVATGPDLAEHLADRGYETWAVGPTFAESWDERNAALPDLATVPPERHLSLDIGPLFGASAVKRAVDLVPRAQAWRPDLVVHETVEFAGAIAAHRSGAAHVTHGIGVPPPGPVRAALGSAMGEVYERWHAPDLPAEVLAAPYLDIAPPALSPLGEPAFDNVVPLRPYPGEILPTDRLPAALAARPTADIAYLTLGTIFHSAPGVFEACLAGLRDLPLDVVVTVGRDGDPERLGPQPPSVLVERYVPQALLLPRCRLVVSHGGAGTMLGAYAHGIPQLILPQAADQFLNAEVAQAAGAAIALQPGTVTPAAVRAAALRLLGEPGFGTAARALRAQIEATPGVDDVLTALSRSAGAACRRR